METGLYPRERMEPEVRSRIVIDSNIRHGKPVIQGTRITVDEIMGALVGGMTYEEIKVEYGLKGGAYLRCWSMSLHLSGARR